MKTYTDKQIVEFAKFCERHDITFNKIRDYNAALAQYFVLFDWRA